MTVIVVFSSIFSFFSFLSLSFLPSFSHPPPSSSSFDVLSEIEFTYIIGSVRATTLPLVMKTLDFLSNEY